MSEPAGRRDDAQTPPVDPATILESLSESTDEILLVVDGAGRIRRTYGSLKPIGELGDDSLVGTPVSRIIPNFPLDRVRARAPTPPGPHAAQVIGMGEQRIPASVTVSTLDSASSSSWRLLRIRDLTGGRDLEKTSALTALRYHQVFERSRDALLVVDANLCILDANPTAEALLQARRPDLVGRSLSNLLYDDAGEYPLEQGDMAHEPVRRRPVRISTGVGGMRRAWLDLNPWRNEDGDLVGHLVTLSPESGDRLLASAITAFARSDTSPLDQVCRLLARHLTGGEGKRFALIEGTPHSAEARLRIGRAPEREEEEWEDELVRMTPSSSLEVLFSSTEEADYVHPGAVRIESTDGDLLLALERSVGIATAVRQPGRTQAVFLAECPDDPVSPRNRPSTGTCRDLLAAALEVHRLRVELQRARRQIERTERLTTIHRLTSNIAHDFNNILTVVGSGVELLLEDDLTDEARRIASEIAEATRRGSSLVEQLLVFAKRKERSRSIADLSLLLSDVREMLDRLLGDRIRVRMQWSEEPLPVRADEGELLQVVMNLAVNARDSMPEGGTVTIEAESIHLDSGAIRSIVRGRADVGDYVRLRVQDEGSGMPSDMAENAFDPFFTTKESGTGLGLAMVDTIVERNGGFIRLESDPAWGTVVEVFFLRGKKAAPDEHRPGRRAPRAEGDGAGTRRSPSGDEIVLLVDDEDSVLRVAERSLDRFGYTVVATRDPVEALERFEEDPGRWDLLVTDMVMPDLTGSELARRARTLRPKLPVLYTSGYPEGEWGEHLEPNADGSHLQKPFAPRELAGAVRRALDGAKEL